jgi:DNA-directed RNA polymerase specialized sigma24 family protein
VEYYRVQHEADVRLASGAAGGSVTDWHEFVLRYSGLILSVVQRYMPACDRDTQRGAYVAALETLYRGGLARYDGQITLASWVMTITRSRCLDALRGMHGRKRPPGWLRRFSERDREIYRLYFIERFDVQDIATELARRGLTVTASEIAEVIEHLDANIDRRSRTRLAYELHARSVRGVSARLLEYLDQMRFQTEHQRDQSLPDATLIETEARDMLARVQASLQRLPEPERQALELRYGLGLGPSAVASGLGLRNRRSAQLLIDRAIATLRRILTGRDRPPPQSGDGTKTNRRSP